MFRSSSTTNLPLIVSVSSMRKTFGAVSDLGEVFVWGSYPHGQQAYELHRPRSLSEVFDQLETPSTEKIQIPSSIHIPHFRHLSVGGQHFLAIDKSDRLYAWGSSSQGQLGLGDLNPVSRPTRVSTLESSRIRHCSAGLAHSLCCKVDGGGQVYAWGRSTHRRLQTERSFPVCADRPNLVPGLRNIVNVCAGGRISAALGAGGELYVWGSNSFGQHGIGSYRSRYSCSSIPFFSRYNIRVVCVSVCSHHVGCIGLVPKSSPSSSSSNVDKRGQVYLWGRGVSNACKGTQLGSHEVDVTYDESRDQDPQDFDALQPDSGWDEDNINVNIANNNYEPDVRTTLEYNNGGGGGRSLRQTVAAATATATRLGGVGGVGGVGGRNVDSSSSSSSAPPSQPARVPVSVTTPHAVPSLRHVDAGAISVGPHGTTVLSVSGAVYVMRVFGDFTPLPENDLDIGRSSKGDCNRKFFASSLSFGGPLEDFNSSR